MIRFMFTLSPPQQEQITICLMASGTVEYKVSIVSANVFIKKVSIDQGVKFAHTRALSHANVKHPVDRVCLKNVSIRCGEMFNIVPL